MYCQVSNYLLARYATENVIVESGAVIDNLKQLNFMSAVRYSRRLWEKALHFDPFYERARLLVGFIKGLCKPVRISRRTYYKSH